MCKAKCIINGENRKKIQKTNWNGTYENHYGNNYFEH